MCCVWCVCVCGCVCVSGVCVLCVVWCVCVWCVCGVVCVCVCVWCVCVLFRRTVEGGDSGRIEYCRKIWFQRLNRNTSNVS